MHPRSIKPRIEDNQIPLRIALWESALRLPAFMQAQNSDKALLGLEELPLVHIFSMQCNKFSVSLTDMYIDHE